MTRRTVLNALLTAAGAALFIWQIHDAGGAKNIRDGLVSVGWGFVPILVLSFGRFALRSYAWLTLLGRPAPLWTAVAATISGDALGNLTPLSLAASEPAKAVYLGRRLDTTQAFAALTAENFFYTVSIAIYIAIGAIALLVTFHDLPDAVRVSGIGALALTAISLAAAAWIAWARPALLSRLVAHISSARVAVWVERVRDFETRAYGSAGPGTWPLVRLASAEIAFHVLSYAEMWLTLYFLTGGSHPVEALVLDAVSRAVNVVFKMVPWRMGVDEVTALQLAEAIGISPVVGLQTALIRKVRMLAWASLGIALWFLRGRNPPH
jgi:hypothetical protein